MKIPGREQREQGEHQSTHSSQGGLATKAARSKAYTCVFCDFIKNSLLLGQGTEVEDEFVMSPADESKYLYHLRTVHGLER